MGFCEADMEMGGGESSLRALLLGGLRMALIPAGHPGASPDLVTKVIGKPVWSTYCRPSPVKDSGYLAMW